LSLYSVLLVADVGAGIAFAFNAFDCASKGDTGWMLVWSVLSGLCFLFAYFLVKD
jgi:hypothetical protein